MFIYKHLYKSQCMALVLSQGSIMQKLNSLVIYNANAEKQSWISGVYLSTPGRYGQVIDLFPPTYLNLTGISNINEQ